MGDGRRATPFDTKGRVVYVGESVGDWVGVRTGHGESDVIAGRRRGSGEEGRRVERQGQGQGHRGQEAGDGVGGRRGQEGERGVPEYGCAMGGDEGGVLSMGDPWEGTKEVF